MKRFHPSPALGISLIALFVALGGTSYAAINSLPRNSVGTTQLKASAVTSSKIATGAVTAMKINTNGLTVPEAAHASSADTATDAASLGGIAPSLYQRTILPSGRMEAGVYGVGDNAPPGVTFYTAVTFPVPLAAKISASHAVFVDGLHATHCSGPGHADAGYLCVYQISKDGTTNGGHLFDPVVGDGASKVGLVLAFQHDGAGGPAESLGVWAVRAP
jgi:hypothetical protein